MYQKIYQIRISKNMPEEISEDMSIEMSGNISKEISEGLSIEMSNNMSKKNARKKGR